MKRNPLDKKLLNDLPKVLGASSLLIEAYEGLPPEQKNAVDNQFLSLMNQMIDASLNHAAGMVPVFRSSGYNVDEPIGRMVERKGKYLIQFTPFSKVTVDDVNKVKGQVMLSYGITETNDANIVLGLEIVSLSVVPRPEGFKS